ncbi:MAG: hypothetical protein ACKOGJ_13705, partial [Phycisphaerales bacterium]
MRRPRARHRAAVRGTRPRHAARPRTARRRCTPRVALRLLRRVRDFSSVRAGGRQDADVVD